MSLPFHPEAVEEAERAVAWYERIDPDLANDLNDALLEAEAKIEQSPRQYAPADDAPSGEEVRYSALRRFPYRVVYWFGPDGVVVLAIAHLKRRPGYWHDRIP